MKENRIKIQAQKATRTGSVRRFDDLGRIVVPREIRKRMGYEEAPPSKLSPSPRVFCWFPTTPSRPSGIAWTLF